MRWLFLFLLVINIAYITWQVSFPGSTEDLINSAINDTKSITLLNERPRFQSEKNSNPPDVIDAAEHAEVALPEVEEKAPDALDEKQSSALVVQQSNSQAELEVSDINGTEPKPEPEPELVTDACYTVGPFQKMELLRSFVKDIKTYVVSADFRNLEERTLTVYWVYLNPQKSRKDARKLGEQLKAKKIKDFYIIRTGEKNNGISLGHFKEKNRATKLAKKVKGFGFDVMIEPVFRDYTVYWLDYQVANGKSVPQTIFEKYSKPSNNEKIGRLARDCTMKFHGN